jgi:hypothetical protein
MRRGERGGSLAGPAGADPSAPCERLPRRRFWGRAIGLRGLLGLLLAALVLVLGISQLVLPRIAARVLHDRVARYGEVQHASVSALPAIELLFGNADSADLDASQLALSAHELMGLLVESKAVTDLTVRARTVKLLDPGFGAGAVSLSDAVLHKRGDVVRASALLSDAALQAALPEGVHANVLAGAEGKVQVQASGQLFGFRASVYADLEVVEGKLLIVPAQSLLAGLGRITLFSDPRLQILSVTATPEASAGGTQSAWTLHLSARLR